MVTLLTAYSLTVNVAEKTFKLGRREKQHVTAPSPGTGGPTPRA